jgi:uncharacterized protein YndB with AHSA1/START domain
MNRLQFSIDIAAPRETVWRILWDDATYRDWTSAFADGSYAVSDWNAGSPIQFLGPDGSGMSAVIEKKRPGEFMSFRHVAEIRNGHDNRRQDGRALTRITRLPKKNGGTTLIVDLDAHDEYRKMFEDMFPKALQRVESLAETT